MRTCETPVVWGWRREGERCGVGVVASSCDSVEPRRVWAEGVRHTNPMHAVLLPQKGVDSRRLTLLARSRRREWGAVREGGHVADDILSLTPTRVLGVTAVLEHKQRRITSEVEHWGARKRVVDCTAAHAVK